MRILSLFAIGAAVAACAWSQAVVEHSVITGAGAAGSAGAMSGVGKSIGNIFSNVNKNLDNAKQGAASSSSASVPSRPAVSSGSGTTAAAAIAPRPEEKPFVPQPVDPAAITVGMDREDLIKACGKPSMKVSQTKESVLTETLWYETAAQEPVVVTLRDGKVAAVKSPAKVAAKQ